jgi:leucyl/phenylalanyl-tRNA--protein transferase
MSSPRVPNTSRKPFPWLGEEVDFPFPPANSADAQGIVCTGGNLSPGLLLSAYRRAIFPWFSKDDPILWWSPDPRFVLFPGKLHVSGTMQKIIKKGRFRVTVDQAFDMVIESCAKIWRRGQDGTWITSGMASAYKELHRLGYAHSVEAWSDSGLAGGLYGVSLGSIFFGESMFSIESDASKAAFIPFVQRLAAEGFSLIDSQVYTDHLAGLGAENIPRARYVHLLARALSAPTRKGSWSSFFPEGSESPPSEQRTGPGVPRQP